MGLLPNTEKCGLRMRGEYRERFPGHRLQTKLLVSDPRMHHGTCVAHVPWCMSGSLTHDGGENVPGIPGTCATRNLAYLERGPCMLSDLLSLTIYIYVYGISYGILSDATFSVSTLDISTLTKQFPLNKLIWYFWYAANGWYIRSAATFRQKTATELLACVWTYVNIYEYILQYWLATHYAVCQTGLMHVSSCTCLTLYGTERIYTWEYGACLV